MKPVSTKNYTNEKSMAKVQARRLETYAEEATKALEAYAEELAPVLQEYNKTSSDKTMALFQTRNSTRKIQDRRAHQDMVEGLAVMIAKKLGLNVGVTRLMAKNHDIGHTIFGHGGEWWLSDIKEKYDLGIYTHSSIGPKELIYRHQIYDEMIERIEAYNPEITYKEARRIRRSLWVIFDGINSHNGELSETEFIPQKEKSELDFEEEILKSHTTKGYDRIMMPATIEGCLIRICDKMAYTPYDMLDGLYEGILERIDEDYGPILQELGITAEEIELANLTGKYEKIARKLQVIFAKSVIENSSNSAIRMEPKVANLMHRLRDLNNKKIVNFQLLNEDRQIYPEVIDKLVNHYADVIEENMEVKELRFANRHYGKIHEMMQKYKGTTDEEFVIYIMGTGPEIYDFNEEMIDEVATAKQEAGVSSKISHERKLALEFGAEYISTMGDIEFINLLKAKDLITESQAQSLTRGYKQIGKEELQRESYVQEQWANIQKAQAEATAQMGKTAPEDVGEEDDAR